MKLSALSYAALGAMVLLSSCSSSDKNPLPIYLAPDSPLDQPGESAARKAEFKRRQAEGAFAVGSTVNVSKGKAFFFSKNPDIDGILGGKMMEAETVTILSSEGMYYYVQTKDEDGGYLRESDLINPEVDAQLQLQASMGLMDGMVFGDPSAVPTITGDGALFPPTSGLTMELPTDPDGAAQVMTNAQGQVRTIVRKNTGASTRFEEATAAIPFTNKADIPAPAPAVPAQPTPVPAPMSDDDIPDLP